MTTEQKELKPITQTESFWLWVMRENKETPIEGVRRDWQWGNYKFSYQRRLKRNSWGRFGGGWNWKLGFQAGGSTIIFDLLVASLRISRVKP